MVSTASQLLAAAVLEAFPNSADPGTTAEDEHDASPGTPRRAMAFIEANPDTDISISDIARAAYVTPRGAAGLPPPPHPVPLNPPRSLIRVLAHIFRDGNEAPSCAASPS